MDNFEGVDSIALTNRLAAKLAEAYKDLCYLELVRDQARTTIASLESQLEKYESEETDETEGS